MKKRCLALSTEHYAVHQGHFDYGIGLEGGVTDTPYGMFLCNYAAVVHRDGTSHLGGGVRIILPEALAAELRHGKVLGDIMDERVGREGISKNEGAIGIFTKGLIDRAQMFRDTTLCAFAPFLP